MYANLNRILENQYNILDSIIGDPIFNVPFNAFHNRYYQIVE